MSREERQKRIEQILKWGGFPSGGVGMAATFNFIRNGQFVEAIISASISVLAIFVAIAAKFVTELIELVLDKIEDKLEDKTDTLADLIVNNLENWLIKLWWTLTSNFQGEYYENLVYLYRAYQTQGLKTPGSFTPD